MLIYEVNSMFIKTSVVKSRQEDDENDNLMEMMWIMQIVVINISFHANM